MGPVVRLNAPGYIIAAHPEAVLSSRLQDNGRQIPLRAAIMAISGNLMS